ncbi:MAG TPA: hypothetical protein VN442_11390 [Bryobacteraceae bacterium]|nr:hypothetical protein [Bryobacteraceae bacterium]
MLSGWIVRPGSPFYSYVATLEETLEMLGVALWIYTLARYASRGKYQLVLRFEEEGPDRRNQ